MKKPVYITFQVAIVLAIALLYYLQFKPKPVAYVNSSILIGQFDGMKDATKVYQAKAQNWQANIDTLTSEMQEAVNEYRANSAKMTDAEKKLNQELLQTKQKQLDDFKRATQENAQQEDLTMTKNVIDQVNAYLEKYGKEKGYDIIWAATESGNIAFAKEELDITDEVLAGLNKAYRGE